MMKNTLQRRSFHHGVIFLITMFFFLWAGFDIMHETGMVGVTKRGPEPYGCICHGINSPTDSIIVVITGPETVKTGSANLYTITMSGGPAVKGGFDVSAGSGELYPVDTSSQRMENFASRFEVTHTQPRPFNSGSVSWQFIYQAPSNAGNDTLYSAGNSVNDDESPSGDQFNFGVDFYITIVDSGVVNQYTVNKGWNIISVPVAAPDRRKSVLFPEALSHAYNFLSSEGYVDQDTLQEGTGYWLKFANVQDVNIFGTPIESRVIPISAGWNMVGSSNSILPVHGITTNPAGIITSPFYGYVSGYTASDTLKPSRGYWVKVKSDGILLLNASPAELIK